MPSSKSASAARTKRPAGQAPARPPVDLLIPTFDDLGAQRVAINMANGLAALGYPTRMVVTDDRGPFKSYLSPNVQVLNLGSLVPNVPKVRPLLWGLAYLRQLGREHGPRRVAIGFAPISNAYALVARVLFRNLRVIIQEHLFWSAALKDRSSYSARFEWAFKHLLAPLYPRADVFWAISEAMRQDAIRNFHVPESIATTIPNPLDISDIQAKAAQPVSGFTFKKGHHYLLGAGRLTAQKNFPRLLRIFAEVAKTRQDVDLIIIGKGADEAALKQLAHRLGIAKRTHFPGFQTNPYAWFARATAFCLTSDWEGLPQVIAESMVIGTPVISHACPSGPDEMIQNGTTGLLLPFADEAAFAKAITRLLDDAKLRTKLGKNAKTWATQTYSLETYLQKTTALISRLTAPGA